MSQKVTAIGTVVMSRLDRESALALVMPLRYAVLLKGQCPSA